MKFNKQMKIHKASIPGLLVIDLPVYGDLRGWFKENWQREKMCSLGLPDCRWVQNNISFNERAGVTRGVHAEPWDKLVSVATGRIFGAWVDLRAGDSFGSVFSCEVDPSVAVYVPRGVGNAYQALMDGTTYCYLVDSHWSAELKKTYTFVNLADPCLSIQWPISLRDAIVSDADRNHPMLEEVEPMAPRRTLVTGSDGQLGRAVRALAEKRDVARWFDFTDLVEFDFSDEGSYFNIDWSNYGTVINCGGYTAVDSAEASEGRAAAWKANAEGPSLLAKVCAEHGITLVHISSDYVFNGTKMLYDENDPLAPLSVYGQTKAAGDLVVSGCPKHYILRCSWIVGEGHNFVRSMRALSNRCADIDDGLNHVAVVDDQFGRLTFAEDVAAAIFYLLGYRDDDIEPNRPAPYGVYNCTGSGRVASWFEIATEVFNLTNGNGSCVHPVTSEQYNADAGRPIAPRPKYSVLDLSKMESVGFYMPDWEDGLKNYMDRLAGKEA